jgi:NitT/TauT family transport system substrate-binding protein
MCTGEWTAENPGLITRFLESLIEAETYIASHPEAAKAIIQGKLDYTEAYVASVWPDYRFSVSLGESLVVAMEDEARWLIRNNLTSEKQVPSFVDYIYIDGLETVRPEAVKIIR